MQTILSTQAKRPPKENKSSVRTTYTERLIDGKKSTATNKDKGGKGGDKKDK